MIVTARRARLISINFNSFPLKIFTMNMIKKVKNKKIDLLVYNFRIEDIKQDTIIRYIKELLEEIESNGINTCYISVVDGNNVYGKTFCLIGQVLNFWHIPNNTVPVKDICQ